MSWVDRVVMVSGHSAPSRSTQTVSSSGVIAEVRRVAADLVEADEPVPAVERGVLDALGHHRPAGLLEPHDELVRGAAPRPRRRRARARSTTSSVVVLLLGQVLARAVGRRRRAPARPRAPARRARRRRGSGRTRPAARRAPRAARAGCGRAARGARGRCAAASSTSRCTSASSAVSTTCRLASSTTGAKSVGSPVSAG